MGQPLEDADMFWLFYVGCLLIGVLFQGIGYLFSLYFESVRPRFLKVAKK